MRSFQLENKQRKSEPDSDLHPYEHPPLEAEPGFWDGKWAEFKRRFVELSWEDDHSRATIILSAVGFIGTVLWMLLFG